MPKPLSLVEAKGWNRRVRMKSADMPAPRSMISIADVAAALRRSGSGPARPAGLASIAFWTRWASACSSRDRIGDGGERRLAVDARPDGPAA